MARRNLNTAVFPGFYHKGDRRCRYICPCLQLFEVTRSEIASPGRLKKGLSCPAETDALVNLNLTGYPRGLHGDKKCNVNQGV